MAGRESNSFAIGLLFAAAFRWHFVELREDCFGQEHSILLRDLHKLVNYHKLAAEIPTTKAEKQFSHVFYAGSLSLESAEPQVRHMFLRFFAACPSRRFSVQDTFKNK